MKKSLTKKSLLALSLVLALSACDDDDDNFTETKNPAWFAGDQAGNVANDVAEPITGNLIISDVNEGEDAINPKTDEATAYGTFTITADGAWSYTLDTANPAVIELADDNVLTDTIALTSVDGTATSIIITIKSAGANVPAEFSGDLTTTINNTTATAVTGQVTIVDPDEGEDVAEVQTGSGTTYGTFEIDAEAKWSYTLDITNTSVVALTDENDFLTDNIEVASADGTTTDLSIKITGVSENPPADPTNTQAVAISDTQTFDAGELRYKHDSALTEGKFTTSFLVEAGKNKSAYIGLFGSSTSTGDAVVDLNIGSSSIKTRDEVVTDISYAQDEWVDVEISWTATDITLVVGDTAKTYTPINNAGTFPIENVIFKLGDNGNVEPASFLIDDFKLYSDTDGKTEVFSDDFEGHDLSQSLDPLTNAADDDSNDIPDLTAPETYHASSNEAVIVSRSDDDLPEPDPETENLQSAVISDTQTFDAGELRYKHDSALSEGKLTASFYVEAGKNKSAYIGLFGSSTSTSNAVVDLNIGSSSIKTRDEMVTGISYAQDEWVDIEVSWTTTEITLVIGETSETYTPLNNAGTFPIETVIFKLGDNGNIEPASFLVDNFKLYSDASGTTEVFADDFEGYSINQSLDTHTNTGEGSLNDIEDPTAAETYNNNSNEVVVKENP